MLFIDNKGITDPAINLALEEYVLRNLPLDESCLLFYINKPSIIIGKNQNTVEEINADYVKQHDIQIVRRLSGGGAVYHDYGNLNYSILTKDDGQSFHNFGKFTKPVTDALNKIGVEATLTGRNDIQVGERKISGNAQFFSKGRMFTHGTLLFDSQLAQVASALNVKPMKIQSKSTKSVRSRVANISEFLPEPMTIEKFSEIIKAEVFQCDPQDIPVYPMTEDEWASVYRLADEQYRSWEWNYGKSPKSNIENAFKFASGIIDVRLQVEEGYIHHIRMLGDYFGAYDVAELEELLVGVRYEEVELRSMLAKVDLSKYFGAITAEELLALLLLQEIPAAN
ncbi:lipoate--protein ligase [Paenibacillus agricola]|uniref:lipoate--protein ligase n=1 Tax=Paenibacillus agricola TaxID=2716264 RepID=A0ABX0J056_9BACL|nr:lipoate--protein ligase [Paenibacillus agricola]NHN29348.1 lipoate--protein ligase [Paenibacillus agricola]